VETVNELETKRNEQREGEQKIGPNAGDGNRIKVSRDMECDVAEASGQSQQKSYDAGSAGCLRQLTIKQRGV
jgi:hypothetical protein